MTLKNFNTGIVPAIDFLIHNNSLNIGYTNNILEPIKCKLASLDENIKDYTPSIKNLSYYSSFAFTAALTNFAVNSSTYFLPSSAILSCIIPTPVAIAGSLIYLGFSLYTAHYSGNKISSYVEQTLETINHLINSDYNSTSDIDQSSLIAEDMSTFDWINDNFQEDDYVHVEKGIIESEELKDEENGWLDIFFKPTSSSNNQQSNDLEIPLDNNNDDFFDAQDFPSENNEKEMVTSDFFSSGTDFASDICGHIFGWDI